MFDNFRRWLNGEFTCSKCDKRVFALHFGFGETICPGCYKGEVPLVRLDKSYILNRILANIATAHNHR